MSYGRAIRVGPVRWASIKNATNAAMAAPTSSVNGVAVPKGGLALHGVLLATKSNVADFTLWGYTNGGGKDMVQGIDCWARLDAVSMTRTVNEAQRVDGVTQFSRIYVQRTDANVANLGCNILFGFSEG